MIILTCKRCKGAGTIPNDEYRICRGLSSDQLKQYFHIPQEDEVAESADMENGCVDIPEEVPCPVCQGEGRLAFDEDEWGVSYVEDEEE